MHIFQILRCAPAYYFKSTWSFNSWYTGLMDASSRDANPRTPRPAANDCFLLPNKYVSLLLYLKLQLQRDELWKVSGRTVLRDPNYWIRFLDPVSRLAIRACPHLYFLCLWKSFFVASDIYLMSQSFWRLVPVEWIWLNCMTKLQFYL